MRCSLDNFKHFIVMWDCVKQLLNVVWRTRTIFGPSQKEYWHSELVCVWEQVMIQPLFVNRIRCSFDEPWCRGAFTYQHTIFFPFRNHTRFPPFFGFGRELP